MRGLGGGGVRVGNNKQMEVKAQLVVGKRK